MSKVQETIQYFREELDKLFEAKDFMSLREFLGTGICDGYCTFFGTGECPKVCGLFHAINRLEADPTNETLNEVKSFVFQAIHKKGGD